MRNSKLESVVTCRKSGFSVRMHTRIQGPGISESSVWECMLMEAGVRQKIESGEKVQDQVRVRAGLGLGTTQRL